MKEEIMQKQWEEAVQQACARIAPVWPLDSFVAVNPYWGFVEQDFAETAVYLHRLSGEKLFLDRSWFRQQWEAGKMRIEDVQAAAADFAQTLSSSEVHRYLRREETPPTQPLALLSNVLHRPDAPALEDFLLDQIGQFLAAYYDRGQAAWTRPGAADEQGLFDAWRQYALRNRSASVIGIGDIRRILLQVPRESAAARQWALEILQIPDGLLSDYLLALLKSIGGWASWCRYQVWQAELQGKSRSDLPELLSIRLVWEAMLHAFASPEKRKQWRNGLCRWQHGEIQPLQREMDLREACLRALEKNFRQGIARQFHRRREDSPVSSATRPRLQAAFCIDVRSEVFRRHLESVMEDAQTIGFAGFFGVPLQYQRAGECHARGHLPVLLPAQMTAQESLPGNLQKKRLGRLRRRAEWKQFKTAAASCFSFVESSGVAYGFRMLSESLGWQQPSQAPDQAGLSADEMRQVHPVLADAAFTGNAEAKAEAKTELAEKILRGLGLTQSFAELVLLFGHGSTTTNNAHRAGLDCGACAGQTGEVSARVTVDLLNDAAVRSGLRQRGIAIPSDTVFLAGMHDTTLDQTQLYPSSLAPAPELLQEVREALQRAGDLTRLERITKLVPGVSDSQQAERLLTWRGKDWSQVRPEWALAGNAAFIAAPRWRTAGANLAGRAFLHDYDAKKDADFAVLTLIMTAPLVVASWINLQYYGSTVDNLRQGSGNKVLHNVVGGLVGVLEGNGGDLRVGLAVQSLLDGYELRHEPLRLSVFIEAPQAAMDQIIAAHAVLTNLVDKRWIILFQINEDSTLHERLPGGGWQTRAM
ncbi:DUF2309 domain-containing protein [Acidithiobacillus sp. YTS05]|nr:DUF2309 domain-containing protein [Acidithiobacillus sp. YTS05]